MLNSLTAVMMYSYFPKSNRMKAPDIPGRIMAQMAIAPERRINHQSFGVLVGERTVIVYAMMAPTINEVMVSISHFLFLLKP